MEKITCRQRKEDRHIPKIEGKREQQNELDGRGLGDKNSDS